MDPDKARRVVGTLHVITLALVVPGIIYHSLFRLPPPNAPGSHATLITLLTLVWLILAIRPFATPTGKPWPYWLRAVVLAGGELAMAALMRALH